MNRRLKFGMFASLILVAAVISGAYLWRIAGQPEQAATFLADEVLSKRQSGPG